MVKIERPTQEQLRQLGVKNWPIWSKEVSVFDWYYNETEICYILEGEVEVTTEDGKVYHIKPGDLVTFQKGLKCVWNVKKPVRKHYNFL
ncbi:cupin domain-containing protein [Pseudothermotoga thermarum]|uniref:(S)-ureidoglycine aminohydrolase cupin domain-containing protein n=1 Tax=Pseudothermotoga thermarum DSM 5069 TaxID=688269 RepID=F7YYT2_9THEM|nr:cupin domain-containing protein [Pseudothermotoga thermarum]AEH51120.1 protein of unknown function DUF861 cupin_3 [Pseudothermotoga thermarum DSM 5069]